MSYASDKGLKVGSKIKALEDSDYFSINEILTMVKDDGIMPDFRSDESGEVNPFCITRKWEHYKEKEKDVTSATKIKFPCCVATSEIKDEETFKKILDLFVANGAIISEGDYVWGIPYFNYYGVDKNAYTKFWDWSSTYGVGENDVTVYTVVQLLAFLPKEEAPVAQTITLLSVGAEVKIAETSGYYGGEKDTSNPKDTKGTIFDLDGDDGLCYIVRWENGKRNDYGLNDLVLWEETPSVASQEAITERLEDNPSVGIDYSVMGTTTSVEPLITITREVKYTVVIKGITFTFTQEELNKLTEELLGFTTL